jgi:hypothetical protein
MKSCSLNDFMEEIKPWLDRDHIRRAEIDAEGRVILYFLDGMKNVYLVDDCNQTQVGRVLDDLRRKGIEVQG